MIASTPSKRCLTALFLCLVLPGLAGSAELVLTNGRIYTVDAEQPWAEAVAIEDGRFVFVGSTNEVRAFVDDETSEVDLGGRLVLPGLVDAYRLVPEGSHRQETLAFLVEQIQQRQPTAGRLSLLHGGLRARWGNDRSSALGLLLLRITGCYL